MKIFLISKNQVMKKKEKIISLLNLEIKEVDQSNLKLKKV